MLTDYTRTILILASNFGYRNERYTIQAVTSKVPIRHGADADAQTDRHLSCLHMLKCIYEPRYEKTGFLHMRKQRRRSASR